MSVIPLPTDLTRVSFPEVFMIISHATFNLHDAYVSPSLLSAIPLLFLNIQGCQSPIKHLNTAFKLVFNGYVVIQHTESEATHFHFSCFSLNLSHSISWNNSQNYFLVSDNYNYRLHKIFATVQGHFMHHLTTAELLNPIAWPEATLQNTIP